MASKKTIVAFLILGLVAVATGCSDNNDPITATPDTTPPALPANVTINYVDGAAQISWDANVVDADLAGYVVSREYNGETVVLQGTPGAENAFVDAQPLSGMSVYQVSSVDDSGNESAPASAQLMVRSEHSDVSAQD